jgi:hypothetical protein
MGTQENRQRSMTGELEPENNGAVAEFKRPGVSRESLVTAGCHHVGEDECARLYGFKANGIAIPFRDRHGEPIMEGNKQFTRVRLDHETDSQKYHQRPGSGVHIYIPPDFKDRVKGSTLILVEGEFKAMALDEAGSCAVGLCGINGAVQAVKQVDGERSPELHDELSGLLKYHQPATVVFAGDADVVFNSQFASEAAKLRRLLYGSKQFPFLEKLLTIKPPVDGLKDFDDCRAAQGESFNAWLDSLLANGLEVESKATPVEIFCALLHREKLVAHNLLTQQTGDAHRLRVKLLRSTAALWKEPGARLALKPLLAQLLNINESEVPGLVRDACGGDAGQKMADKANRNESAKPLQGSLQSRMDFETVMKPLIPLNYSRPLMFCARNL